MDSNEKELKSIRLKKALKITATVLAIISALLLPTVAWFSYNTKLISYAPISRPEALSIGAGHTDMENKNFEDIRYLYFDSIDAKDEAGFSDYVFCVYGQFISGYKLQLGYTTNNQFTYELYNATESTISSEGAVMYATHADPPVKYYYSVNGGVISGTYLNLKTPSDATFPHLADGTIHEIHDRTYGKYNNLDQFAEPVYWQTSGIVRGNPTGYFVHYYILRVRTNGKESNDRETDVLCIAAKSFSIDYG